jgi:hypothetical protein
MGMFEMRVQRRTGTAARLLIGLMVVAPACVGAQRPDSAARAVPTAISDSLRPPITPRRAFFYSFLAPGYSQSVLGRHKAAAAFLVVEAMSIAMIRESAADVHEARRLASDSVVVTYVGSGASTGVGTTGGTIRVAPQFSDKEIRSRESHVEDWVALLIANHLFAGADAFVAANLWDVRARLGLRLVPSAAGHGAVVAASLRW